MTDTLNVELVAGMKAPDFVALDQTGKQVALQDFKGKKLALFFYPEDDTLFCTKQVCNLRDHYAQLQAAGFAVVGISPDSVESHQKFTEKYQVPYPLLADPDKKILMDYGVWGEKNMYGKIVIGVRRNTFLIDENGIILHIIKGVRTETHANQILNAKIKPAKK